ncbi:hypothetical protein JKP88DRAFT_289307 [Tribonema minus]|uniref:Uncharacterized protein n=1 Tax=Tribonema minus TaxID=303371 RepID=A0A835Z0S4_9STRA|nr:hypothetical protein JKP88DRAFT_289307 [Tribonema minus]
MPQESATLRQDGASVPEATAAEAAAAEARAMATNARQLRRFKPFSTRLTAMADANTRLDSCSLLDGHVWVARVAASARGGTARGCDGGASSDGGGGNGEEVVVALLPRRERRFKEHAVAHT